MKKIRTIVIDDEPFARKRIIKLLETLDFVTIIDECKNGKEALNSIQKYQPDLIFLDIQMPDFNGFEVLKKNEGAHQPFIIFVTAYDQYALKAFDVRAVDYLLKPYDDDRFFQSVEHARSQILLKDSAYLHKKMMQVLEQHEHQNSEELSAIEIKEKGRTKLIKTQDIYWIEADGNYLQIHLKDKRYIVRQTMQIIENQIDKGLFLRIHRSFLLNNLYVESIKYKGNNQYCFYMKNGEKLISSRSYKETIIAYLEDQEIKN